MSNVSALVERLRERRTGKRVVQCHGCFDLLHLGHIRHFQAAKQAGDLLVVTVTPDQFVKKGPSRPVFTAAQRAEAVASLRCVDDVAITEAATAADAIRAIRPDVFAKGPDYSGGLIQDEQAAIAEVGATVTITETPKWSSTALLERPDLSAEARAYLAEMRGKYSLADIRGWLEKASDLKVLVIGDAIRDEYNECRALGKSGKDPILAVQFLSQQVFDGGAHAVAKHVTACCDSVQVVTGPTTAKRRYNESYPRQKMFEVYEMDEAAAAAETPYLLETLPDLLAEADLVVVADYGHGLLTPEVIGAISHGAKFLAVNTQANAGNHGYNTISKYQRADFISLSERELRLDKRDQYNDVASLAGDVAHERKATVLITRGEKGCIAARNMFGFMAPALTTHTVDRTGAGDAVFGVTACCAAVGMPLDLLTFMASVVGTQAVGIVGNARYIERESLWASIEALLG